MRRMADSIRSAVVFQFAVIVVIAVNRQQHRDRVSEIVVNDGAEHTLRKIRLLQFRHLET